MPKQAERKVMSECPESIKDMWTNSADRSPHAGKPAKGPGPRPCQINTPLNMQLWWPKLGGGGGVGGSLANSHPRVWANKHTSKNAVWSGQSP